MVQKIYMDSSPCHPLPRIPSALRVECDAYSVETGDDVAELFLHCSDSRVLSCVGEDGRVPWNVLVFLRATKYYFLEV